MKHNVRVALLPLFFLLVFTSGIIYAQQDNCIKLWEKSEKLRQGADRLERDVEECLASWSDEWRKSAAIARRLGLSSQESELFLEVYAKRKGATSLDANTAKKWALVLEDLKQRARDKGLDDIWYVQNINTQVDYDVYMKAHHEWSVAVVEYRRAQGEYLQCVRGQSGDTRKMEPTTQKQGKWKYIPAEMEPALPPNFIDDPCSFFIEEYYNGLDFLEKKAKSGCPGFPLLSSECARKLIGEPTYHHFLNQRKWSSMNEAQKKLCGNYSHIIQHWEARIVCKKNNPPYDPAIRDDCNKKRNVYKQNVYWDEDACFCIEPNMKKGFEEAKKAYMELNRHRAKW